MFGRAFPIDKSVVETCSVIAQGLEFRPIAFLLLDLDAADRVATEKLQRGAVNAPDIWKYIDSPRNRMADHPFGKPQRTAPAQPDGRDIDDAPAARVDRQCRRCAAVCARTRRDSMWPVRLAGLFRDHREIDRTGPPRLVH